MKSGDGSGHLHSTSALRMLFRKVGAPQRTFSKLNTTSIYLQIFSKEVVFFFCFFLRRNPSQKKISLALILYLVNKEMHQCQMTSDLTTHQHRVSTFFQDQPQLQAWKRHQRLSDSKDKARMGGRGSVELWWNKCTLDRKTHRGVLPGYITHTETSKLSVFKKPSRTVRNIGKLRTQILF